MSRKQIARTVLNGQQVTFLTAMSVEIATGYVYGMDDYHWAVVSPTGDTTLVHKAGTHVRVHSEHTYEDESTEAREHLDGLVLPFRQWAEQTVFGRHPKTESSDAPAAQSA